MTKREAYEASVTALATAKAASEAAEAAYQACTCEACTTAGGEDCALYAIQDAAYDAMLAAESARDDALRAYVASDEPQPYTLRIDGVDRGVEGTLDEAREEAEDWAREGDWADASSTAWVDVTIHDLTGERLQRVTVQINPEAPSCTESEHDWQRPIGIVGGIEENPGVRGHGGGVIVTEVCTHCGCARETDTWAQRPDTGEQGLESVSYEPRRYATEVAAMRETAIAGAAEECTRWHLEQGWEGSGDDYEIGPMVGDREALEERLGRGATAGELEDLELAIRTRLNDAQEDAA